MSTEKVLEGINELRDNQTKLTEKIQELSKPTEERKGGPFHIRKGEDPLSSRGYSYGRLFSVLGKQLDASEAKIEVDIANRLQKLYVDSHGYAKATPNSILAPFSSQYLAQLDGGSGAFAREVGEVVKAGVTGYDREEVAQLRAQKWGYQKALSWTDESAGGALVGPPLMGELIELMRNNEALMAAGCRTIAMPPNGRVTFPRQTSAATAYWPGESTAVTASEPATGDLILSGKKLGVLVKVPNELFRFAAVSVEQFIREDIARVSSLAMDKELLEGVGSTLKPKGLINYAGITTHTASTTGANGDTYQPEDVAKMIAKVEEKNATFKAFIMRPLMYAAISNRRADAVSAADGKGAFMFNLWRSMNEQMDLDRMHASGLYGYPVVKSTQVSNVRVKGSGVDLSYILGGDFNDYILAMGGVIEFKLSTEGDTPFAADQTWIRGLQYVDGGPRHEASFVLCDSLLVS